MSATTAANRPSTSAGHVTPVRVLVSEWRKAASLRSTWVTLAITAALVVSVGALAAWSQTVASSDTSPGPVAAAEVISLALAGVSVAIVSAGVLGVMTITGEYSSGTIRPSVGAVPRRTPVLLAKAVVVAGLTWVTGVVSSAVAYVVADLVLGDLSRGAGLTDGSVLRAVLGAATYLTLIALLGLGAGAVLRSTPGGISVLLGGLLALPIVALLLPGRFGDTLEKYLPSNAGQQLMASETVGGALSPTVGGLVLTAYVVVCLVVATVLLKRRDA